LKKTPIVIVQKMGEWRGGAHGGQSAFQMLLATGENFLPTRCFSKILPFTYRQLAFAGFRR
jgi:hypothetical protein